MRLFLSSLCALIPEIEPDAIRVLALPPADRWDALYFNIIIRHLVRPRDYDTTTVDQARVLWFRYVSVCGHSHAARGVAKTEIDMPRTRRHRGSSEYGAPEFQTFAMLLAAVH